MAKLVVLSEGFTGRTYELKAEKTTIGRMEDNAFQIPESSVSSHHCEIFLRGNEVVVKDLQSTNGTYIAEQKITGEGSLKPGQVLRLGQVEMRLEGEGQAGDAAGKKVMDQTRVIPQGVKMNELEQGERKVSLDANSPFKKQSNKVNKVFIGVSIALAVLIIVFLVIALQQMGG